MFGTPSSEAFPCPACSTIFGTRYAAAPDILLKQPYTRAVDAWGLGIVLYMLVMGQVPFSEADGLASQSDKIARGDFDRSEPGWSAVSASVRSLVEALLVVDPVKRLRCEQILCHAWL